MQTSTSSLNSAATLTGQFDLYGVPLAVTADHPLLFEMVAEDTRFFRRPSTGRSDEVIHLTLQARRVGQDGTVSRLPGGQVTRYDEGQITVTLWPRQRRIHATVIPDPVVLRDPAYHLCFTRPVSFWLKQRGLFLLHAGCVAEQGEGVLILGRSRAGKSTLAVSAVRASFRFLSDEQPVLSLRRGALQARAFPRRIRLDRPSAMQIPELQPLAAAADHWRVIFPMEQVWPGCLTASCEPRLLIFPRFLARGRLRLRRVTASETLARLLQDPYFVWHRQSARNWSLRRHLALFEVLAQRTRAYALDYGVSDILEVPSVFRRLLRESSR